MSGIVRRSDQHFVRESKVVSQRWSQKLVTEEIRRLNEENDDLRHSRSSKSNPRLVSAAIRYFGSWGNAVMAAGIDYASIRKKSQGARVAKVRKWRKESIAREIKKLIDSGDSLAAATVREKHPALFSAATSVRYFGSWRNALTALGVDYDAILARSRASSTTPRNARPMRTLVRRLIALSENITGLTEAQVRGKYPDLHKRALAHFDTWDAATKAASERRGLAVRKSTVES